MPYLQLSDKQIQLRFGETRIGAGPEVEFRLPGPVEARGPSVLAIADVGGDSHVAIRRAAPDVLIRVNGVALGAEPTPLIHGDKIEVGGAELYFGDDKRGGSTQFIPSTNVPEFDRLRGPAATRATAATGGRVISLVDGREYMVAQAGLVFGRDAGCDVVIPSSDVSRRHAEIVAGDTGYVVTDTSTNGLFVNGDRIEGMQILGRGDVLRIGPEEFRFYADAVAPAVAAASRFAPPPPRAVAPPDLGSVPARAESPGRPPAAEPAPSGSSEDPSPALPAPLPAPRLNLAAASASRHAVATLEVIGGSLLRGQRYAVTTVLTHLGRGEHNDIVIAEESVSDSHAKLQRRDGVWYVTDLGSTNGTYVGGRRIDAEERLDPAADLRVGGVKLAFSVAATEPLTVPHGATREVAGIRAGEGQRPPAPGASSVGGNPTAARPEQGPRRQPATAIDGSGASRWLWLTLGIVVVGAAIYYLLQGR